MRKLIMYLIFASILLLSFCSRSKQSYEVLNKDGINIVKNYDIENKNIHYLKVQKETEIKIKDYLVEKGLVSFGTFAVSKTDKVCFFSNKKGFFLFDNTGKLLKIFGSIGQGPKEVKEIINMYFNDEGKLIVYDVGNRKIIYFDEDGNFLKEVKNKNISFPIFYLLKNDNYIKSDIAPSNKEIRENYVLYTSDNKKIKILSYKTMKNPFTAGDKIPAIYFNAGVLIGKSRLYSFSQIEGYKIKVFDFNGKLIEEIERSNYKKVKPDVRYRKMFFSNFKSDFMRKIKNKFYFPDNLPPFHTMFLSDKEEIFVQTYETDKKTGNFIFEIFDNTGKLIYKEPLPVYVNTDGCYCMIKNNKLYTKKIDREGKETFIIYKI